MSELIYECVLTTCGPQGAVHAAPMGVRYVGDQVVLMPFKPSTTLANILNHGSAVLNWLTDVRVFAGCVTGRRDWPTVAVTPAVAGAPAQRLACALGHVALRLVHCQDDVQRPVLTMARGESGLHQPFMGFNRAQAAVLEGAVLVSRLHLLPPDKVSSEWAYLQIAIDKTAGPQELEAWGWLNEALRVHRTAVGAGMDAAENRGAA